MDPHAPEQQAIELLKKTFGAEETGSGRPTAEEEADYEDVDSEEGTPRAADAHHRSLMMDEDGEHYYTQDWEQCPGCQSDNPHYEQARGAGK